jgi:imidazoleglycerol-phosphate dehydratase
MREASTTRETRETRIEASWNLDRSEPASASTGSGFLDHMLEQLGAHSGTALKVSCKGDTHVDLHHSVEDVGIVLGKLLKEALGNKVGIERYGFYMVAMDETLARCALDLSGRFHLEWGASIAAQRVGDLDIELVEHFFRSLAENASMTLHMDLLRHRNAHHAVEGLFKAFARALAMSIGPSRSNLGLPSTKGVL